MPTKNLTLRTIISAANDLGEQPAKELDESLTVDGFTQWRVEYVQLAAAGADVAVAFTAAVALFVFSHDNPFSLRLAAGETLMGNLRQFGPIMCDDEDDEALTTSVLLTGNGVTPSDIEVWIVEKP